MRDLVIIGAGGFGREVKDLAFTMKSMDNIKSYRTIDLYTSREFLETPPCYPHNSVIAIGDSVTRRIVVSMLDDITWVRAIIHPSVIISVPVIDEGTIICANSIISIDCKIGKHVHINFACTIGHDCIIGDFVTISPGVHISGNVTIGDEVFIGTGAVIREKLTIGEGATIGMGAVVVKDVPPGVTVVGNPAREINEMKKLFWKVRTKKAQAEPIDYESNNNPECSFINPRLLCGTCGDGFIMYGADEMKQVHLDDWAYMKELIQEYTIGTFR